MRCIGEQLRCGLASRIAIQKAPIMFSAHGEADCGVGTDLCEGGGRDAVSFANPRIADEALLLRAQSEMKAPPTSEASGIKTPRRVTVAAGSGFKTAFDMLCSPRSRAQYSRGGPRSTGPL